LPFSVTRKILSLFRQWKWYSLKHTWFGPLTFIAIFLSLFAINPTESNPIHHFIFLSYQIHNEDGQRDLSNAPPQYGKGLWDIAFVTFYTIVLSFTREFIMQEFLQPLARRTRLKSRAKQFRFMEQAYTAIYFAILGPFGLYVMNGTPVWYFNVAGMYEGYPHRTHDAVFKFYYLFQAAYWAQQAIVMMIGMEKPRKDFKELIAHHVITLSLIGLSYRFHFTYMGLAVYITHDISDFFLAVSQPTPKSHKHRTNFPNPDFQTPKLHRPRPRRPLLHLLHVHLDLPTSLPQYLNLDLRIPRIQNHRAVHPGLGK
jgi:acyl-CoA-dependent ceramide synthase